MKWGLDSKLETVDLCSLCGRQCEVSREKPHLGLVLTLP